MVGSKQTQKKTNKTNTIAQSIQDKKTQKAQNHAREEVSMQAMKAAREESKAKARAAKQAEKDANAARKARKKAKETEEQLSNRSIRVNRQIHRIGLLISIAMSIAALVLLGTTVYMISQANHDFISGNVTNTSLSRINQVVASVLLLLVTALTVLIFRQWKLYNAETYSGRELAGRLLAANFLSVLTGLLLIWLVLFPYHLPWYYYAGSVVVQTALTYLVRATSGFLTGRSAGDIQSY